MPTKRDGYVWQIGKELPLIEPHSIVKHKVIGAYLHAYIKILCSLPQRETLCLSLVDGFSGGGLYRRPEGDLHLGSPFVLLNTVRQAEAEINAKREQANIRARIDVRSQVFLIEKNIHACSFLRKSLPEHYSSTPRDQIHVINADFLSQINVIITAVKKHGRSGRCIFVLDQYGYKEVPLQQLSLIFSQLPGAEIILTFAIDALINYVSAFNKHRQGKSLAWAGYLTPDEYDDLAQIKAAQDPAWKFRIQSCLIEKFRCDSGAKFVTPFFIMSRESHRGYWLLHLSTHSKANDAMKELHWELHNTFAHYGGAGLDMLAYDPREDLGLNNQSALEFMFDSDAEKRSKICLLDDVPNQLARTGEISFGTFAAATANDTPVTKAMLKETLITLTRAHDIELVTPSGGRRRSENPETIRDNDVIRLKSQRSFLF